MTINIRAVIFDFDGVIVDSAGIKTQAFYDLFRDRPEHAEAMAEYHRKHMGISRYEKFRYFYREILKKELTQEREEELGRKFSELVLEKVKNAPLIEGAEDFLKNEHKSFMFFIASGTPDAELRQIVSGRQLDRYFKGVYGSPETKEEIIQRVLSEQDLEPSEVLYVGDARSDLIAAGRTGILFVAKKGSEEGWYESCPYRIDDFMNFKQVISNIEKKGKIAT